jgi:hypothetical protein
MTPASREAMQEAYALARSLPEGIRWSVLFTEDVEPENQAAFNVYVPDEAARVAVRQHLKLGLPVWEDDVSEEHDYSPLITLSISETKEMS